MLNAKFHWFRALTWSCGSHPYPGLLLSGMGALLFPHVIVRFISLLTCLLLLWRLLLLLDGSLTWSTWFVRKISYSYLRSPTDTASTGIHRSKNLGPCPKRPRCVLTDPYSMHNAERWNASSDPTRNRLLFGMPDPKRETHWWLH